MTCPSMTCVRHSLGGLDTSCFPLTSVTDLLRPPTGSMGAAVVALLPELGLVKAGLMGILPAVEARVEVGPSEGFWALPPIEEVKGEGLFMKGAPAGIMFIGCSTGGPPLDGGRGAARLDVCKMGGPPLEGLPGAPNTPRGAPFEVNTGGGTLLAADLRLFRMDLGVVLLKGVLLRGPLFLGETFCFDLGLGCVIIDALDEVDVLAVVLVVVLVAGNSVGGALEIWVLPVGG